MAAEELAEFELEAMRDPRNWGRPVAAAVVGATAAGALVLVRARQRHRREQASGLARARSRACATWRGDLQKRLRI